MHTARIDRSQTTWQSRKHKAAATLINSYESETWNNCSLKKCILERGWTFELLLQKMHFRTWDFKMLPRKMHFRTWDFQTLLQNVLDNYSVSDFSSISTSDSNSGSGSGSDSSSASKNLVIFVFFILYLHSPK